MSGRQRLERILASEPLAALDEYVRELVDEYVANVARSDKREWYPLDEAAQLLGCSYDAVRMRVRRGRLESRRQGRTVLVRLH
jgi:excisionase family DNA binding protein